MEVMNECIHETISVLMTAAACLAGVAEHGDHNAAGGRAECGGHSAGALPAIHRAERCRSPARHPAHQPGAGNLSGPARSSMIQTRSCGRVHVTDPLLVLSRARARPLSKCIHVCKWHAVCAEYLVICSSVKV